MAAGRNRPVVEIARRYAQVLREAHAPFESVWLFGSAAAGQDTEDSDIDIAVVMREVAERFSAEMGLMKARRSIDLRIEPHVLTSEEWESQFYGKSIKETGVRVDN